MIDFVKRIFLAKKALLKIHFYPHNKPVIIFLILLLVLQTIGGILFLPEIKKAEASTFSLQVGLYIGNGLDNRAITGLGFQPDLVMIKEYTSAGSDGMLWKSSAMTGEITAKIGEAEADIASNSIQSLDSDGFTIGSDDDLNTINESYFWIAFSGSDCNAGGIYCVGTYTGNGTSKSVNTGFQPNLVTVKSKSTQQGVWRSSAMGANETNYFAALAANTGGQMIQSLDSTGFTIGNDATVNTNSQGYWFFAFAESAGAMDVGTYTGDGTDNRDIDSDDDAGLTFKPGMVFVKNASTTYSAAFTMADNYGDMSFLAADMYSYPDRIQKLLPTGGFQVGTTLYANGTDQTMYYAAFGNLNTTRNANGTFTMNTGSYAGTGVAKSITGVGFRPDLVIIKHHDQATDQYAVWRTSVMGGDMSAGVYSALFANAITSLDNDGFSVGTDASVNTADDTYYWTAFGNAWRADKNSGASDFMVGAYNGTGVAGENVDRMPFQPDFIFIKRSYSAGMAVWRPSIIDNAINRTCWVGAQLGWQWTNFIKKINSDGFERGSSTSVNDTGGNFYFMFKNGPSFTNGTYTGNGGTQDIDVGFQPDLIWTKKSVGGTGQATIMRTSAQTGDAAQSMINVSTISGAITSINSDGFSVGADATANESTYGYYYTAWKIPTVDLSWNTGGANFQIYQSDSLTWNAGSLICSGTLTDDNAATSNCTSDNIDISTQYRVQVTLKNAGDALAEMSGAGDFVDHIAVKGGWAGTNPTLGTCAFYDVESDDGSTTCSAAWNATNDVRLTNTGAGEINIAGAETQGFMYLITTDTDTPSSDSTSYYNASIDSIVEDSSKIGITGPSIISITIDDGIIQYNVMELASTTNTTASNLNDTQTVTNMGNSAINLEIKGQDTACPWLLNTSIGDNKYTHEFSINSGANWTLLTLDYQALTTGLASSATFDFDLRLTIPDTNTCFDQQSVDVIVQASAS